MIIYEGTSLNDPVWVGVNQATSFTGTDLQGRTVMPTLTYGASCLTVRLISNGSNTDSGWKAKMECVRNCQFPEASLDTFFYKYDAEGNFLGEMDYISCRLDHKCQKGSSAHKPEVTLVVRFI